MAVTSSRIAGLAFLSIDGKPFLVRGDLEYRPSKFTRETLTGQDQVHGYKELPVAGMMKATLSDGNGVSIADINAMTNVTLVAELANGKTVVGAQMWIVDTQVGKTTDGTIEAQWEGRDVSEF